MTIEPFILFGMTVVFGVIGYLLTRKDAQQESQIKLLFVKHDADERALNDLKLEIARQHYVKAELDQKFDKLEIAFREEIVQLGDRMEKALMKHIN